MLNTLLPFFGFDPDNVEDCGWEKTALHQQQDQRGRWQGPGAVDGDGDGLFKSGHSYTLRERGHQKNNFLIIIPKNVTYIFILVLIHLKLQDITIFSENNKRKILRIRMNLRVYLPLVSLLLKHTVDGDA